MVSTDVVWVSETIVCTLRLSVRVFTPLPKGVKKPKPRFWHFEPWFSKVLEIFENTLFYITADSFGSGWGGRERFIYPPLVRWERDAISPSFLPFERLQCFVEISSWFVHLTDAKTVVVHRSPAASPASPSPTPVTNRRTNKAINSLDMV